MIKNIYNWIKKKLLWLFVGGVVFAGGVDVAIQTQGEITKLIEVQQELCLKQTGKYCQFKEGIVNPNMFKDKIRKHDYEVRVDVWEGGAGDLHDQQGYTIRYCEGSCFIEPVIPVVPFVNSTST